MSRRPRDPEAGATLVELIVYSTVGLLAVLAVGGLFLSGWQAEAATRDRDAATGAAGLITSSLQTGIRNASTFTVTTTTISGQTADILRASVLKSGGGWSWECRAWALTPAGDFLYSDSLLPSGEYTGWTKLVDHVAPDVRVRGTISGHPFADHNPRLEVGIAVEVGKATVPVTAGVLRQTLGEGAPSC